MDQPDLVREEVRGVEVTCYRDRPRSVVEVLQTSAARWPDEVLVVDPARGSTTSYAGFASLVEGAAGALLDRRLKPGDRVAVLARNGLEAAVAIWACARAGLVHVGLPVDAPLGRLTSLLDVVEPSLVLVQEGLDAPASAGAGRDDAELLVSAERVWDAARPLPDEDETYSLIATSGTTGRPKAVRVTGRMTGHAAVCYSRLMALGPRDRTAIHLPFAWVSGHVTQLTPAMHTGGSAVTMAGFSAAGLVAVVAEHGVTWLDVVPSIWEQLLRTPGFGEARMPTVRTAVFGGAPAPPGTLDRVRARMPRMALHDVYALSETCAPVTVLADSESRTRPGSVGRPAAFVELRTVDPQGVAVEANATGEVWVRSPATTPGYWGSGPSPVDEQGWLHTGDAGRLDTDGFLHVEGRTVDLIIRGGVNVYPAEVERVLMGTGLLSDAAVVGLPSVVTGQAIAAAVVALEGTAVDRAVLRRAVQEQLGRHAVPRPLRVLDDLPRNSNGKVDRVVLAGLLSDGGAPAVGAGSRAAPPAAP